MNQVTKLFKLARKIPLRNITSINLTNSEEVFEDEYLSMMAHKHCNYGEFYPLESCGTYMSHKDLQGIPIDSSEKMTFCHFSNRILKDTNTFRIKKQPKKTYSYWKNSDCFDRRPKNKKIYLDDEDEYLTKMANLHIMGTD